MAWWGRSSARETACRVVVGSIALQTLQHLCPNIKIVAFVQQIQESAQINIEELNEEIIESNIVRCPDPVAAKTWNNAFWISNQKDSVGGIVRCVCLGIPVGLGEPCFDKLEADLAKAMLGFQRQRDFLLAVVLMVFI